LQIDEDRGGLLAGLDGSCVGGAKLSVTAGCGAGAVAAGGQDAVLPEPRRQEAEAVKAEAVRKTGALEVPMHLRTDSELDQ